MKIYKSLLKYFGLFIVLYGVLFWLFSTNTVATATNNTYRAIAEPILESLFSKAYLKLEKDSPPESDIYTIRAVYTSKPKIVLRSFPWILWAFVYRKNFCQNVFAWSLDSPLKCGGLNPNPVRKFWEFWEVPGLNTTVCPPWAVLAASSFYFQFIS